MRSHSNVPVHRHSVPWVVAADHHRARFFMADAGDGALVEVDDLINPTARARDRDLISDRPGRLTKSGTSAVRAVAGTASPRERAAQVFAQKVCRRLAKARADGELAKVYVIAEPDFLGLLRANFDPPTQALVAGEIDKTVTQQPVERVRELLPRRL